MWWIMLYTQSGARDIENAPRAHRDDGDSRAAEGLVGVGVIGIRATCLGPDASMTNGVASSWEDGLRRPVHAHQAGADAENHATGGLAPSSHGPAAAAEVDGTEDGKRSIGTC